MDSLPCAVLTFGKIEWLQMAESQVLCPFCLSGQGPFTKQPSSSWGLAQCLLILESQVSVSCQPVELFKQTNHNLPREPGGTSLSCYHKASLPITLFPSMTLWPCGVCSVLPPAVSICDEETPVALFCPVSVSYVQLPS